MRGPRHEQAQRQSGDRHRRLQGNRGLHRQAPGGRGRSGCRQLRLEQGERRPPGRGDYTQRRQGHYGAGKRREAGRHRASLLRGEAGIRPARHPRQQRRNLRVLAARRRHRRALPQAVRPERPGSAPRHEGSHQAFRPGGWQRHQYQLNRQHPDPGEFLGLQRHQGGRRCCDEIAGERAGPAKHPRECHQPWRGGNRRPPRGRHGGRRLSQTT